MKPLYPVLLVLAAVLLSLTGCVKPPPGYPVADNPQPSPSEASPSETAPPMENLAPENSAVAAAPPTTVPEAANAVDLSAFPEPSSNAAPAASGPAPAQGESQAKPGETKEARTSSARTSASASRRSEGSTTRASSRSETRRPRPDNSDPTWRRVKDQEWGNEGRYPWASEVKVSSGTLSHYSNRQLSQMAAEIEARQGRSFSNPAWQQHFDEQDWYYKGALHSRSASEVEAANLRAIRAYQRKHYGRAWEPSGND
ncbi:YARHG domain-containing protein [bacterium]|nr:YARHG domain-containing protein [bacterium]